jgi:nitronate monooxygenase
MLMWTDTAATRILKIRYPVVQGPFGGGSSSVELTATVSNLGGLGSFGAQHLTPEQIMQIIARLREFTACPFAVNLWVDNADAEMESFNVKEFDRHIDLLRPIFAELGLDPPQHPNRFGQCFDEQVAALIEAAPPAFSFVFGIPSPEVIRACRDRGIVTIGNATTVDEARAIEDAGIDMLVATGAEAGGHRVSFLQSPETVLTGTFSLLPQVRKAVRIPLLAAGGIVDGRGIAAALILGADGAQIGTAFLACEESGANNLHRAALFSDSARSTILTRAFSGRLARTIRSGFVEGVARDGDIAPYPAQNWLTAALREAALDQGRSDLIPLYAGQSASLLHYRNASELLQALVSETNDVFRSAVQKARSAQLPDSPRLQAYKGKCA